MKKIYAPDFAIIVLPLQIFLEACSFTPRFPVESKFLGETISTTVDSEVARYYLENYLLGSRLSPDLDTRIGELYNQQKEAIPTREELKEISERFSVDFAALFLADRLWADENNRKIQNLFNRLLKDKRSIPNLLEICISSYMILFVPGWDYVENGHLTGIALGNDHFFAEDPKIDDKTIALTILVITYLEGKKHSSINAIDTDRLWQALGRE